MSTKEEWNPLLEGLGETQCQRFKTMQDEYAASQLSLEKFALTCDDPVVRERFLEDDLVIRLVAQVTDDAREGRGDTLDGYLTQCPNERTKARLRMMANFALMLELGMLFARRDPHIVVCKFGGSSASDAGQFRKVAAIVRRDRRRRYVVVSAPGKRSPDDSKVTDLLIQCHIQAAAGESIEKPFGQVVNRFRQIVTDLGLRLKIEDELEEIRRNILQEQTSEDYAASRGEYLSGLIAAELLGYAFVDSANVVSFTDEGKLNRDRSLRRIRDRLATLERAVITGFYGRTFGGHIKTLERGGSDVTGAMLARAVKAIVYENWTDTDGVRSAPPNIIDTPTSIPRMTYSELSELAAAGVEVFHEEAVIWMRNSGSPVNVRNTNNPDHPGTVIVPDSEDDLGTFPGCITGLALRTGFVAVTMTKMRMNKQIGFLRILGEVLERNGVSVEHVPSGKNTLSVVIAKKMVEGKLGSILEQLGAACRPEQITVAENLALIAIVGRGMAGTAGIGKRIFGSLGDSGVNVRLIDQGASELSIVVGVDESDAVQAMKAVYGTFFP